MKIIDMPIGQIKPYDRNPRNNDAAVEPVAASIREFGFKQPIVVDAKNVIICGHTRYRAAKRLGLETVPVLVADDLSPAQVKAYRLADNKTSEAAEWLPDELAAELGDLQGAMDMSEFGFDISDIALETEDLPGDDDDFDPTPPEATTVKPGDIYRMGRHRLMCGDSTNRQQVSALTEGGQIIDLLLTDPPYGVDYTGKTEESLKIENDAMTDEALGGMLTAAFAAADETMRPGAAFYIWHASRTIAAFMLACSAVDWEVRQTLIWVKNSLVLGRQDYQWKHEPCLYGWKEGAAHCWESDRKQTTVLEFDRPTRNAEHPTMKPVPLFEYQISNRSKKGMNVLDLFGGSGTTLIACEQTGRNCYMMELDPHYCEVIIRRWESLTGKKAERIN